MNQPSTVLVTGGSGFIAEHCMLKLLEQGHRVRATLRSLARERDVRDVRAVLATAGLVHGDRLSFVAADLLDDRGWAEAAAGVDTVLHVASPVRLGHVENAANVIVPAREGTLRMLRAARDAGARRVVLTSAFHAVGWGWPRGEHAFTEDDWTVVDGPGVDAYGKSKTLAERTAWDFIAAEDGAMTLCTTLPVAVMGPILGRAVSGANHEVQRLLDGDMPGLPNLFIPVVDVHDVARAHLLAIARDAAGEAGRRVPTRSIPDVVMRIAARFKPEFRPFVHDLGLDRRTSNERANRILEWTPRPPEEAIASAARSLVDGGLIRRP